MALASLVLPFLPLTAVQVLLNNLLSDLPMLARVAAGRPVLRPFRRIRDCRRRDSRAPRRRLGVRQSHAAGRCRPRARPTACSGTTPGGWPGSIGSVLDPIVAIRHRLVLDAGAAALREGDYSVRGLLTTADTSIAIVMAESPSCEMPTAGAGSLRTLG